MIIYQHVASAPRAAYDKSDAVRTKTNGVHQHMRNLAEDLALDPDTNVVLHLGDDLVRVGISEYLDECLRESETGLWTN